MPWIFSRQSARLSCGTRQRGVDPVEVGVAGDERRQRNTFGLHRRRDRRGGDIDRGQRERVAVTGHRCPRPGQHDARRPRDRARGQQPERYQRQPPDRGRGRRTRRPSARGRVGEPSRGQQAQHDDPAHGADDGGDDVDSSRAAAGQHRRAAGHPGERRSRRCRSGTRRVSIEPATAAMTAMTASTSIDSASLSAVPNVCDRPFLHRAGREVDDRRPDRGAGIGLRADERGHQLGDAERHRGSSDACHRP